MPVKIIEPSKPLQRQGRGLGFDRRVRALALLINGLRSKGVRSIDDLMIRLNEAGVLAPGGGRFSRSATYRVLKRLRELGLGQGPRTVSTAAGQRQYKFRPARSSDLTLKRVHEH
jgi:hypothetical protein